MTDLDSTFTHLTELLRENAVGLVVVRDDDEQLYYEVPGPTREFFGAVMRKKSQVAFHLMPVYHHPELLDGMSPELRRRMQGKSCFNFTKVDPALFSELGALTSRARGSATS